MCVCVPVCVRSCTRVRGVFPPPSSYVHVGKFDLPDYCGHALTHTLSLFSEASPALATPHTHMQESTHAQTHTVKVQEFAKLQQTGFLLRSHTAFSLSLLPPKLVNAGCFSGSRTVGSLVSPYFLFLFIPASVSVCVCV